MAKLETLIFPNFPIQREPRGMVKAHKKYARYSHKKLKNSPEKRLMENRTQSHD
jgi:hypothetical protein